MPKKQTPADGQVKARVLTDCLHGAPNDVVVLDTETAAAGVAAGTLDTSAEAVAYAEGLTTPSAE